MRISYILNSSLPSNNASSLQIIKTSEALVKHVNKVFLITPDTGLNKSVRNFYDLKSIPKRIKLIDASGTINDIHEKIRLLVDSI